MLQRLSIHCCLPALLRSLPTQFPFQFRPLLANQVAVDRNAALHGVDLRDISLHRISLMERNRVMRGMIRCCSLRAVPHVRLSVLPQGTTLIT